MKRKLMMAAVLCMATTSAFADVKVGLGGPMTGPNAALGEQFRQGAEQAAADINEKGGVNGEKLVIVVGDDRSDPMDGVSVANKFVADGVQWVVGHYNSGASIPASEVYAESGIIQVTPASTNPTFTERGMWNTFRVCGRDDQQGTVAGNYLADKFAEKKIAVVHDKTPYGQGLADETRRVLNGRGIKEAVYEGINPGEKDYSALIAKLKQAGIEVLYYGGLHTEAGLIIRQLTDQGLSVQFMTGDGILSTEFTSIAGPGADGVLMTFTPDPRQIPNAASLIAELNAKKVEPEAYTIYSYAAVQLLALAAEAAGTNDPQRVADTIHSGKVFPTVVGDISYNSKGDRMNADYVVYQWKKGPDGRIDYAGNQVAH